ncbi:FXYD domain-containing ion transport regulator 11-like [Xiphophorus maculatus]|uniref:FXYD domain-containing ion transport regulator n=1 Tax=Xiphophorus maculatus TaxID=8083 RepID=A0A3B5QQW8_XIPMA|nr:FXYD domain-containing ion transport regulator 11-like [Xiphophorus maculatus]XP_027868051.1 FXYD domain-containing ion transport regulator 11-like [Xiphophorus couchianus]XP_032415537.1 FXYD domain-containing ion transport regulator 11-like [Xiphophorus hellerii]
MGRLSLVTLLAVLFSIFMETEANPFVYNYERLRIGGLVFTCLLIIGAVLLLVYKDCSRKLSRKRDNDGDI